MMVSEHTSILCTSLHAKLTVVAEKHITRLLVYQKSPLLRFFNMQINIKLNKRKMGNQLTFFVRLTSLLFILLLMHIHAETVSSILSPFAPALHNDSWGPVLVTPDSMHANVTGSASKIKTKI